MYSISLNGQYDAWIIVHYHLWIIQATIFFNDVFIASLLRGTKDNGNWFKHNRRYTETITWQTSQTISIKHGVNGIYYFSHLIRANESRNKKFINEAKKLEALLVFADYSYLASSWNWIPMSFGSICHIYQKFNEMLASCESKWGFERQYGIFGWKRRATTRKRGAPDGKCCVEKRSAQKVLKECRMKKKSAISGLESANRDWGGPKRVEEHRNGRGSGVQNGIVERQSRQRTTNGEWEVLSRYRRAEQGEVWGIRSAACNIESTIQTQERQWELRRSHSRQRSAESNTVVPIKTEGIQECLSQRRSAERGGINCRMKWKRVNLGQGVLTGIEEHLT